MNTAKLSILCMMFLVLGVPQAALLDAALPGKPFEYRNGLFSIEADQAPLEEVLSRITKAAGVEIIVFDPIESVTVTLRLNDRPLEQALSSVLKGYSYSVVYDPEKRREGVRIVEQPERGPRRNMPDPRYAQPSTAGAGGGNQSPLVLIAQEAHGPPEAGPGDHKSPAGEARESSADKAGQPGKEEQKVEPASGGTGSAQRAEESTSEGAGQAPVQSAASSIDPVQGRAEQSGTSQPRARSNPVERLQKLITRYEERVASGVSDREYENAVALSGGAHQITHDLDRIAFWQEALKRHAGR